MWHVEKNFKIRLGGNIYIDCENLVECRGRSLFAIKRRDTDGLIGIDFDIYDVQGNKVATIRRGTIVSGDKQKYEFTHESHHYKVVEKETGRTVCDIKRKENVKDVELEVSVDLYTPSGFHLQANPQETNIGGIRMTGNTMKGCRTAIHID